MKTKIIIKNYHRQLVKIYDDILSNLPHELEKTYKDILQKEHGYFPILEDLSVFIDCIEDDFKEYEVN